MLTSVVKPKNLELYNGRYELSNGGIMTITTESDRLFAQLTGQPKFEIFPMIGVMNFSGK